MFRVKQVNVTGVYDVHGSDVGSAAARVRDRNVRVPDAVQRVPSMFGPTGNGRVPEGPGPEDAGPGHADGEHSDCRR